MFRKKLLSILSVSAFVSSSLLAAEVPDRLYFIGSGSSSHSEAINKLITSYAPNGRTIIPTESFNTENDPYKDGDNLSYSVDFVNTGYNYSMDIIMNLNGSPYSKVSAIECEWRAKVSCAIDNPADFTLGGEVADKMLEILMKTPSSVVSVIKVVMSADMVDGPHSTYTLPLSGSSATGARFGLRCTEKRPLTSPDSATCSIVEILATTML